PSSHPGQMGMGAPAVGDSAQEWPVSRRARRVDGASELQASWFDGIGTLGLSSGASAPEKLVDEMLKSLRGFGFNTVETLATGQETKTFALPAELRTLHASSQER
ncbi:MAG: hypothetical protein L0K03_07430, partial [Bifidobacterium crudilactis]|nr:hypothetical protein [Bifidobacterium crudilactis]